ncbi:hypothetical protein [Mycolicibacterium septicum]|uniref:hypothetical protein n=1 Tax=Mycolicibacterium septicum TaxID=98668 RepID=UPI00235EDD01|nr:hypothetical protein [Mycolicibacterium septicum]
MTADLSAAILGADMTARRGALTAASIRQSASADATAIATDAPQDPAALVLLVSRLDDRLGEMQDHITRTRSELQSAAEQIANCGRGYTAIT